MRELVLESTCPLSASQLWELKLNHTFDEFNAAFDKRSVKIEKEERFDDENGKRKVRKELSSTLVENPVPRALRGVVDAKLIAPNMTSEWYIDHYDEDHACVFTVDTPAFSESVKIRGKQWLTEDGRNRCVVSTRVSISCTVSGLGQLVEKLIGHGMQKSYSSYDTRVPEFLCSHPLVADVQEFECEWACQTEEESPPRAKTRRVRWIQHYVSARHARLKEAPEHLNFDAWVSNVSTPCGLCAMCISVLAARACQWICGYKKVNKEQQPEPPTIQQVPFDSELSRECRELGVVD
jgi:hypothetical protein